MREQFATVAVSLCEMLRIETLSVADSRVAGRATATA